jgi:hypothetical protein
MLVTQNLIFKFINIYIILSQDKMRQDTTEQATDTWTGAMPPAYLIPR